MSWVVGIDTGGTFTDVFAANTTSGELRTVKLASTPDDPSRAILGGLKALESDHAVPLAEITALAHGTTVGTNALIQRRGGKVAVITTKGFRDLLEIGRQIRPKIFDLQTDMPAALAERPNRFEVSERVLSDGSVLRDLDASEVDAVIDRLAESGAEVCAVCFLFSFLNSTHEEAVRKQLSAKLPGLRVSLSSEVQPEFREFERLNTTVINAYLQPVMEEYIDRLADGVGEMAPNAKLGVNQSSGGLMDPGTARAFPVRTALSGPAAGVVGAVQVARQTARPNVITADVGGTSADVALIADYKANVALEREVAGFPIRLPMMDIDTIGAGGGSIAWFDRDGLLKVGPNSAGAVPGPACYGHGGTEPTVSDANLVLGRLGAELVDGGLKMHPDLARKAIEPVAAKLGFSVEKTALSILAIVVSNMVRALRTISVERGYDPREFALMPFGGAGPLHAREIALELGISEIVVPAAPGLVCAQGLLVAEQREDFVSSRRVVLDQAGLGAVQADVEALDARAVAWLNDNASRAEESRRELRVDARYVGQNFELQVPVARAELGTALALPALPDVLEGFFREHEKAYGFANRSAPVELVNLRMTAFVAGLDVFGEGAEEGLKELPEPLSTRPVWFGEQRAHETAVYRRDQLAPGVEITGPAIIEQLDSTLPIFPGDRARMDGFGNIVIEVKS